VVEDLPAQGTGRIAMASGRVVAILAPWYRVRCPDGEGKGS
jgi:hypothetical protein